MLLLRWVDTACAVDGGNVGSDPVISVEAAHGEDAWAQSPCKHLKPAALSAPSIHHVLLVEDDPLIAKTLAMSLRYQGFEIVVASNIEEATRLFGSRSFDLLMLDIGLPDGNGIDLCRAFRERDAQVPILMVTALTDEETAVRSIDGGADDHVRKPYGLHELTARMKRLIQRHGRAAREISSHGAIAIDHHRHAASVGGQDLRLGKREFEILSLLVKARGDAVRREQILDALQCDRAIYDRTIDSHLSHLRRKLKDAGAAVRISAIYGVGYRLEGEA